MDRLQQEVQRSHKREADLQRQLSSSSTSATPTHTHSHTPSSSSTTKPETNFHLSDKFLDTSSNQDEHYEALKQQLKMARDATNAKDDALVSCREELAETKLTLDHCGALNTELQNDKARLTERLRELTRRHEELDKEIVASRTSVDFNSLQMSEKDHYIERLQDLIEKFEEEKKDYEREKIDLNSAEQRNLDSLRKVHEKEIQGLQDSLQSMEESCKEDIDKLIQQHSYEIEKCIHDGRVALEKANLEHSTIVQEMKSEGVGESYKQREGLKEIIFEKEAEILRLKGVIDLEKSHTETQKNQNTELKAQLAAQTNNLEGTSVEKGDMLKKHDAVVSALDHAKADLKKYEVIIDSLNLELQHEREALSLIRSECKEAKSTVSSLEAQIDLHKSENVMLKKLTEGVEENSRENERLKGMLQASKEDMVDMTAERDQACMNEKITREESLKKDELITMANSEVKRLVSKIDELTGELKICQQQLSDAQSEATRLEATVIEQREASGSVKGEVEALRSELLQAEKRLSAESYSSQSSRAGFERSCSRMLQALLKWDNQLSPILEGSDSQSRGNHNSFSLNDILHNPDDLFENSVSVVERIQYKMDRILKIRDMFGKSSERILHEMSKQFEAAHDKSSLMTYRVKDLEEKSKRMEKELEREAKRKDMNSQEMKSFQNTIVTEHVNELKEAEERASSLTVQLQSERHKSENLERDLLSLRDENSTLRSDRYEISQTESAVSSLSEKFQTMAESNRLMSLEIEERGQIINKLNDTIQALKSEKSALLAGVQRLTSQIEMRDQIISGHEDSVASFKSEISKLKTRQINPDLEKSIIDSQNILRSSISNFSSQVHEKESYGEHNVNDSALTSALLSDNAMSSSLQTMFNKLSEFVDSVSSLSKKSEQTLHQYENIQLSSSDSTSIESDIFELLDANSRLSSKLLQLAIDFKRLSRKVLLQSGEESQHQHHDHDGSKQFQSNSRQPSFDTGEFKRESNSPLLEERTSTFGRMKMHDDLDTTRGSTLGIESLLAGAGAGAGDSPLRPGDSAYTPVRPQSYRDYSVAKYTSESPFYQQASSPSANSRYSEKKTSPHSVKFADSHSRASFGSLSHTHTHTHGSTSGRLSTLGGMNSHSPTHSHLHMSGQNHSLQLSGSQHRFHSSQSRDHSVASMSSNRLSKLGSDLQTLAGKLDSFNAKSKSGSQVLRN
jgi:chromosome segregation ATPase